MKKKFLMAILCVALCGTFTVGLTGCGGKESSSAEENENTNDDVADNEIKNSNDDASIDETEGRNDDATNDEIEDTNDDTTTNDSAETPDFLNDNASYFIMIDGQKFYAGDKLSSLSSVGLTFDETAAAEELDSHVYLIGVTFMLDANGERLFQVTPFNETSETIKAGDAVIGGIDFDSFYVRDNERASNIEVYGGLKIGSTEAEVKAVFGEPSDTNEGEGWKTFRYDSDEIYRDFKFSFDENGLVDKIEWQNLVYSE